MNDINKKFFETFARLQGIEPRIASKIIDGKYKPYLSKIDDKYYEFDNVWDAKHEALRQALKTHDKDDLIKKLKRD